MYSVTLIRRTVIPPGIQAGLVIKRKDGAKTGNILTTSQNIKLSIRTSILTVEITVQIRELLFWRKDEVGHVHQGVFVTPGYVTNSLCFEDFLGRFNCREKYVSTSQHIRSRGSHLVHHGKHWNIRQGHRVVQGPCGQVRSEEVSSFHPELHLFVVVGPCHALSFPLFFINIRAKLSQVQLLTG